MPRAGKKYIYSKWLIDLTRECLTQLYGYAIMGTAIVLRMIDFVNFVTFFGTKNDASNIYAIFWFRFFCGVNAPFEP